VDAKDKARLLEALEKLNQNDLLGILLATISRVARRILKSQLNGSCFDVYARGALTRRTRS
jgi:hypothetical protein